MKDFEKLEHLLLNKSFRELTPSEVNWLSTQGIDQQAFLQQREVLLEMKNHFSKAMTGIPSNNVFQQALAEQRQATVRSQRTVWLIATAMLFLGVVIGKWSVMSKDKINIVYEEDKKTPIREVVTDTVFLKQIIDKPDNPRVIYRDRIQRDTVYLPMPMANKTTEELQRDMMSVTSTNDLPAFSRSAKETEALLKVLVQVY